MLHTPKTGKFFTAENATQLKTIGLPLDGSEECERLTLAGLIIAPLLELSTADGATTTSEFAVLEESIKRIEREFELATKEDIESLATPMGLLPIMNPEWKEADFTLARSILADVLSRCEEEGHHAIRNFIASGALLVADASGGLLHLLTISRNERSILHVIIEDLGLSECAEGLHLIGKIER